MSLPAGAEAPAAELVQLQQLTADALNNIFNGLPECIPPDSQGSSLPYLALFVPFARSVGLSDACVAALDALAHGEQARVGGAMVDCEFFPAYGCVLVQLTSLGAAAEPTTRLQLLGLDGWTFGISGPQFCATADAPAELFAGSVAASELPALLSAVHKKLSAAQKRKEDQRSAAGGKQGHQKTPAMILCLLEEAILEAKLGEEAEQQPRGGFTDVGLHTGGSLRATAWPLAASVIRLIVEQLDVELSFVGLLPLWELWLAEQALRAAVVGQRVVGLDAIAHMMHTSVRRAVAQIEDGFVVVADFETRVAAVHSGMMNLQTAALQGAAAAFMLPPLMSDGNSIDAHKPCLPVLHLQPPLDAQSQATDLGNARKRAFTNLGWLPLPPDDGAPISALASWLRVERIAAAVGMPRMAPHLRAAAAERWIFTAAVTLLPVRVTECASDVEAAVQSLHAALQSYRAGIKHALATKADGSGRLLTEVRSRETLACWAMTCLADRLSCVEFPLLKQYHMALNYADLRHLSLSDGLAHDALHAVCAYLRSRTNGGTPERPLFSLLHGDKTFEVATQIGSQLDVVVQAWSTEQLHATGRRDAHWAAVQRKQALAASLRCQLVTARSEYDAAVSRWSSVPTGSIGRHSSSSDRDAYYLNQELESAKNQCRSVVNSLESQLAAALKAPANLVQPLPSERNTALAVLFFLYMPPTLRTLSELSFEAQAALLPRPLSEKDLATLRVDSPPLDWEAHHWKYQGYALYTPSPAVRNTTMGAVRLGAVVKLPKDWPSSVDDMTVPSHGVWHPDGPLRLSWEGCNPWLQLPRARMRDFYTPQVLESSKSLQWALPVDDRASTAPTRGNLAVAEQADRPDWLSKTQFLTFAGVRAYGHAQLRKLACALRDRSLPLAHDATHVLVRAALHQLGPLRATVGDTRTFMPWKADLTEGPLLDVLHHELADLADEIADRISEHASLLAILDVLAYIRTWEPASQRLAALRSRCADIARRWSQAMEEQVAAADDPSAVPAMRAKQCVFAMYAVLAYAGSDTLQADEAASLLRFAVMAHDGYIFETDASPPDGPAVFASLRTRCDSVMAARAGALVAVARADGGSAITAALKCVQALVPLQLTWTEVAAPGTANATGCFEAITPDGHLYSMNALTGIFLLDGSPPRSLPSDVLAHPLYLRSFGERDFEVSVTGAGALRTARPLTGCIYEFFMGPSGRLDVKELLLNSEDAAPHVLELLDGTPDGIAEWGAELPIRLRELYSHWLCRESNALFVRDTRLPLRHVSFVGLLGDATDEAPTGAAVRCFRVPLHLRNRPARELAGLVEGGTQLCDVLQLWPSGTPVPALSKFEKEALTHWYRNQGSGTFTVELPRYRLEFVLRPGSGEQPGRLESKDYNRYSLVGCQQLTDALPGLSQYLLLEPAASLLAQPPWTAPPLKVVVPAGIVRRNAASGAVRVVGDDAPGAARGTWTYDAHARFGELRAHFVAARLHLAALHAACDTGVPEPQSGLAGAELALSLVRRSFINRPPSVEEQERCDNVAALSRATPALHMACAHWSDSARQLAFLQPEAVMPFRADDADPIRLMDSAKAYQQYVASSSSCAERRQLLTPAEELRMLGKRVALLPARRAGVDPQKTSLVKLPVPLVSTSYVDEAEKRLSELVASTATDPCPFPLDAAVDALSSDPLGADMLAELQRSWDAKQRLARHALEAHVSEPRALLVMMQAELSAATNARVAAEGYLMHATAMEPGAKASQPLRRAAAAARLRRAAGLMPLPSLPELALTALAPDVWLPGISPLLALSKADTSRFARCVLTWMQLCVLEDKLTRLTRMATAAASANDADAAVSVRADIVRELRSTRTWDVEAHPDWLAFELDGALQIRPAQHALAEAVLAHAERRATKADEPGPILQLNMGEVRPAAACMCACGRLILAF